MIRLLMMSAALGAWHMDTVQDPLGQAVYVASVSPDGARPHVALRFLCGGITGVVLQFNLGETQHARAQFLPIEPAWEDVHFAFPGRTYESTAKRAPITDGLGTYEIKGSDAAYIASLLKASESVSIARGDAAFTFPLSGASFAIEEVVQACPFKYPNPAPPRF